MHAAAPAGIHAIASAVRRGELTATASISSCLQDIARNNGTLNCFTSILTERALQRASEVDSLIAQGKDPGPLAGVPFSVKNLFDVAGVTTLAGSLINQSHAPASTDAVLHGNIALAHPGFLVNTHTLNNKWTQFFHGTFLLIV